MTSCFQYKQKSVASTNKFLKKIVGLFAVKFYRLWFTELEINPFKSSRTSNNKIKEIERFLSLIALQAYNNDKDFFLGLHDVLFEMET